MRYKFIDANSVMDFSPEVFGKKIVGVSHTVTGTANGAKLTAVVLHLSSGDQILIGSDEPDAELPVNLFLCHPLKESQNGQG